MPLDPDFVADCPYGPEGLLIDEVLEIDPARSRVVARMPTPAGLPLTVAQRSHPTRHPSHVAGGLLVHMTGMIGFLHAYYLLGLRHREGWIGYGARIHGARFHDLAPPGAPLVLEGWATQVRRGAARVVVRYGFRFSQEDRLIYEGDQTAVWTRAK